MKMKIEPLSWTSQTSPILSPVCTQQWLCCQCGQHEKSHREGDKNLSKHSEPYLGCVRTSWLQPAAGTKKWMYRTFLEVYLLVWVCVSCCECVCAVPLRSEEKRIQWIMQPCSLLVGVCVPLARALICFPGCRLLHMYIEELKSERGGREQKKSGEGGAARRRRLDRVHTHTHTAAAELYLSLHRLYLFPLLISLWHSSCKQTDLSDWCQ